MIRGAPWRVRLVLWLTALFGLVVAGRLIADAIDRVCRWMWL